MSRPRPPGTRRHDEERWSSIERVLRAEERGLAPWQPPLIIAATAVAIVGGFYLGGPGLGMAVGALSATAILVMAARNPPRTPIDPGPPRDSRRRVLVVLAERLRDEREVALLGEALAPATGEEEPRIQVVALCRSRFLDRWTSDVDRARQHAQRHLVFCLACLAKGGLRATACLGEEGVLQTVEDALRSFPAREVVLVTGREDRGAREGAELAELRARLRAPLRRLSIAGGDRPGTERGAGREPSEIRS